jgi:hypothetical protein
MGIGLLLVKGFLEIMVKYGLKVKTRIVFFILLTINKPFSSENIEVKATVSKTVWF